MAPSIVNPNLLRLARKNESIKLLIVLIGFFALLYGQKSNVEWLRIQNNLQTIVEPAKAIPDIAREISRWFESLSLSHQDLQDEIERLNQRHLQMSTRLNRLVLLEQENQQLKEFLGLQSRLDSFHSVIAEVRHLRSDSLMQSVFIDVGVEDGVRVGYSVVDAKGVVGQVVQVGLITSKVRLIVDSSINIPVFNSRNGLRTIAQGEGQSIKIVSPDKSLLLQQGDIFYTSGLGGHFIKGLPVGMITHVDVEQYFVHATLHPMARLKQLNKVLILIDSRNRPAIGPPNGHVIKRIYSL